MLLLNALNDKNVREVRLRLFETHGEKQAEIFTCVWESSACHLGAQFCCGGRALLHKLIFLKNDVCNTEGLSCSMGRGAHYTISSFFLYLIGSLVYVMAGVRLRSARASRGELEESLLGIGPV